VTDTINTIELAAELTAAWLANPNTRTAADDVPAAGSSGELSKKKVWTHRSITPLLPLALSADPINCILMTLLFVL
jgi:hypothetical protein